MKSITRILTMMVVLGGAVAAQVSGEPDIRRRLELIEQGQGETVKAELTSLMTNFQNHPGVMYLQAILTTDGSEAAKVYQDIVDNFPSSEWADDALYKLYQYYYSIGLFKTADQKLAQLRQDFPFSAYASEEPPQAAAQPMMEEQPPARTPPAPVEKFSTAFTIQVGAFTTLQNAEDLKAKFEKEGYSSNIFTMVSDGKKLHKVWVGEFQTYEEAKRFTAEVRKKFSLESIVVSR